MYVLKITRSLILKGGLDLRRSSVELSRDTFYEQPNKSAQDYPAKTSSS